MSLPREGSACRRSTARGSRTASRAPPAARPTCSSTIARRSTCPAVTSRSVATPCAPSADSTRSTCVPATTSMCAGGCRSGRRPNRVRAGGARLASPSRERPCLLAAAGRVRRGEVLARPASPRAVHRREDRVEGAHLQSAAVRAVAVTAARQPGDLGLRRFPSVYHMQAFRWRFCRTRPLADRVGRLHCRGIAGGSSSGRRRPADRGDWAGSPARHHGFQCVRYALASDIESLPTHRGHSRHASRAIYRLVIAWLHLLQPFARASGYLRGLLWPPRDRAPPPPGSGASAPGSAPRL